MGENSSKKRLLWLLPVGLAAALLTGGLVFGALLFLEDSNEPAPTTAAAGTDAQNPQSVGSANRPATGAVNSALAMQNAAAIAAAPADPRDAIFAAFVLEATQAIDAAAHGLPHDVKWNGEDQERDLRGTSADTRSALAALGPMSTLGTFVTLEAMWNADEAKSHLRTGVLVFPDRRVRWLNVRAARENPNDSLVNALLASRDRYSRTAYSYADPEPTGWLPTAAPALQGEIDRIVESLSSSSCVLPAVAPVDVAQFPKRTREQLEDIAMTLPSACYVVQKAQGPALPRVGSISVLVSGQTIKEGEEPRRITGVLMSSFRTQSGKLVLSPVTALVDEEGQENSRRRRSRRYYY